MDLDNEGFPLTSIREIKILKNINHPNIVKLFSVVNGNNKDRYGFLLTFTFLLFLLL